MSNILEIKNLNIKFRLREKELHVIRDIDFNLHEKETVAIVGESGSGKSVFTKSLMGMLDKNGWIDDGVISFKGEELQKYTQKDWLDIRGSRFGMIFQDPMTALNPLKKIGVQISETISFHKEKKLKEVLDESIAELKKTEKDKSALKAKIKELKAKYKLDKATIKTDSKKEAIEFIDLVGIPDPEKRYEQYPFEFSGGMRQRVVIAIAICTKPEILICDEPTTALDVTIQAQILDLIKDLQDKFGMSVIFITHDLGVVAKVADRVAVMYGGEIVEVGTVHEIFKQPTHPYTYALLKALPQLGVKGEDLYYIKGTPPNFANEIVGDSFAPRNPYAMKIDYIHNPPYFKISETHYAKTWLLHEKGKKHLHLLRKDLKANE